MINFGNFGGLFLDSFGWFIGVNIVIYSFFGVLVGIGFFILVDVVSWVVFEFIEYGWFKWLILGVELVCL